ncbi:tail protein X [Paenibacillus monticola]|uniref:Phage tail protein n=1 Tax=Paenibacillus monticola TaxID=2666075 RepID=A0A7X2H1T7_9BACL|nr:tail protein X [Paenibacillus monticola]MRN51994.1 phage tail protein [Paenibacillus monticola]
MIVYKTVQGDTWDGISYKVYGQANLMTLLLNANPGHAGTVILSGNISLTVPDKPADASETLPPWRKDD